MVLLKWQIHDFIIPTCTAHPSINNSILLSSSAAASVTLKWVNLNTTLENITIYKLGTQLIIYAEQVLVGPTQFCKTKF